MPSFENIAQRKASAFARNTRFHDKNRLAFDPDALTPEEEAVIRDTEVRSSLVTDPNCAAVVRIFPHFNALFNVENVIAAAINQLRADYRSLHGYGSEDLIKAIQDYFKDDPDLTFFGESVSEFIDKQLIGYWPQNPKNRETFLWFEGEYNMAKLCEDEAHSQPYYGPDYL